MRRTALSLPAAGRSTRPGWRLAPRPEFVEAVLTGGRSSIAGWPMPTPRTGQSVARRCDRLPATLRDPLQLSHSAPGSCRCDQARVRSMAGSGRRSALAGPGSNQCDRHRSKPFIPDYPGREAFGAAAFSVLPGPCALLRQARDGGRRRQFRRADPAELSKVGETIWVTQDPPAFLPDEVDGRVLFERATARWKAQQEAAASMTRPAASAISSWCPRCSTRGNVACW